MRSCSKAASSRIGLYTLTTLLLDSLSKACLRFGIRVFFCLFPAVTQKCPIVNIGLQPPADTAMLSALLIDEIPQMMTVLVEINFSIFTP